MSSRDVVYGPSTPCRVDGVPLGDWVDTLIAGQPLDDVHCDQREAS